MHPYQCGCTDDSTTGCSNCSKSASFAAFLEQPKSVAFLLIFERSWSNLKGSNLLVESSMAARVCACGYSSDRSFNMKKHFDRCKVSKMLSDAREQLANENTKLLAEKDRLLSEKDDEIKWLREQLAQSLKTPRTVTNHNDNRNMNNRYIVNQSVNVFGKESTSHITDEQLQRLIQQPETAVANLVRLKHSVSENQNIRVPNKRERRYEVVVEEEGDEGGQKRWKSVDKSEVLAELWETNEMFLEGEADEEQADGERFVRRMDEIKDSKDCTDGSDGGKRYKSQLDQIHNTLADGV